MPKWRRRTTAKAASEADARDFDHRRFAKLCSMLQSPHDGERSAAALKASEMLAAAGLTWRDIIRDQASLLDHLAQGSDDPETRARRFWKSGPNRSHRDQA